jgi:pimeloyl-ACP methyl ester carboxylesterase
LPFDKRGDYLIPNPKKTLAERLAPMPTKYIQVKGYATQIYYRGKTTLPDVPPDLSRGRKILLVHGAGSNGHTFHRQVEALGEKQSPVALDLPGHGRSSGVEGLTSVGDYADFIAAMLDALQLKSTVVLGHSMGGAIAMELALRHPARVDALVLSSTAAKFNLTDERIEALRGVMMGRAPQAFNTDGYSPKTLKENFDVVREGWMEQIKTDPRVRYTDLVACSKVDLRESISKIDKPTLVLCGADDQGTTVKDAELIVSKIKGAKLEVIPDAGHYAPREQPARYIATVAQFLESLR